MAAPCDDDLCHMPQKSTPICTDDVCHMPARDADDGEDGTVKNEHVAGTSAIPADLPITNQKDEVVVCCVFMVTWLRSDDIAFVFQAWFDRQLDKHALNIFVWYRGDFWFDTGFMESFNSTASCMIVLVLQRNTELF